MVEAEKRHNSISPAMKEVCYCLCYFLLLPFALLPGLGKTSVGDDHQGLVRGYECYHNGQYKEASKLVRQALAQKNHNSTWDELAGALIAKTDSEQLPAATKNVQSALELDPKNPHLLSTYALLLLALTKTKKGPNDSHMDYQKMQHQALESAQKAVALAPNDGRCQAVLGHCYAALSRVKEANNAFTKALKFAPEDFDVNELASVFYSDSALDSKAAILCYERLLKVYPNSAYLWVELGKAKANDEDLNGALEAYSVAIKKDPNFERGFMNKAGLEKHMARWADAVRDYTPIVENEIECRLDRSHCYEKLNQHEKALADLNIWIEFMNNAYAQLARKNGAKLTVPEIEAAVAKDNVHYRKYMLKRVDILSNLGRYDDAISSLGPLIKANPLDEDALNKRQILYRKQNKNNEALADLNRLVIVHATPELYAARADVYSHLGQKEKAAADLKRSKDAETY